MFDPGVTLDEATSTLDRIYINSRQIDEPLLTAIDRDQDGVLGGSNDKNVRNANADQEYYFLNNRLGSVMGLLDADRADRMLEYYRYSIYGEVIVLPVVDNDEDGLEDMALDLSDNFSVGSQRASVEFGNFYLYTAQRFDDLTGLYYFRNRYFEPSTGKFVSRDPLEDVDDINLYHYVHNRPAVFIDPYGTTPEETIKAAYNELASLCTKTCIPRCEKKCDEKKCKKEAKMIAKRYVEIFERKKKLNHPEEGTNDIHMGWKCYMWAYFNWKHLTKLKLKCWTIKWVGYGTKKQLLHNYIFASLGSPKGKGKLIKDCGKVLDPWKEKSPKVFDINWKYHKWNFLFDNPKKSRGFFWTGKNWVKKPFNIKKQIQKAKR